jgi:hypothetical protein
MTGPAVLSPVSGGDMTNPYPYPSMDGYQQAYAPRPHVTTNGLAIASLVLGIVWIYWIGSILALVFGYVALRQIRQSNGWQQGSGMAIAGIVLGWIGVGFLALVVLLAGIAANDSNDDFNQYDGMRADTPALHTTL